MLAAPFLPYLLGYAVGEYNDGKIDALVSAGRYVPDDAFTLKRAALRSLLLDNR